MHEPTLERTKERKNSGTAPYPRSGLRPQRRNGLEKGVPQQRRGPSARLVQERAQGAHDHNDDPQHHHAATLRRQTRSQVQQTTLRHVQPETMTAAQVLSSGPQGQHTLTQQHPHTKDKPQPVSKPYHAHHVARLSVASPHQSATASTILPRPPGHAGHSAQRA